MKMKKGFRQMVDEAKSRIKTIGLDEAKKRHGHDDVVFVDLRDVRGSTVSLQRRTGRRGVTPGRRSPEPPRRD
jgi:hypothetical protein